MMARPIVSVIVSTYNSEKFFRGRIENLLEQTISPYCEIIIVNSGSEQQEEKIVLEYSAIHENIKYIKTAQRETIYRAWNRGIAAAKGDFITNANTDDRLRKDALDVLSAALAANPRAAIVYADQIVSGVPNQAFDQVNLRRRVHRTRYSRLALLHGYLAGSQPMWRSSLHSVEGIWFDESFEVAGDYEFACRVAENHDFFHVDEVLGVYYKAGDKSNKEFENVSRTLSEACTVQEKYMRRFMTTLTAEERQALFVKSNRMLKLPRGLFYLERKIVQRIAPSTFVSSKLFWCWVASLIRESEGDLAGARRFCLPQYLNGTVNLVQRQYAHLVDSEKA